MNSRLAYANVQCLAHRATIKIGVNYLARSGLSKDLDVDIGALLIGENGKVQNDNHFVFYNNPVSPDKAVRCVAPFSLRGYDESLTVDFRALSSEIHRIVLVTFVTAKGASLRSLHWAEVSLFRHVQEPLITVQMTDLRGSAAMLGQFGRDEEGEWGFFHGEHNRGGIKALCKKFGLAVKVR